MIYNLYLDDFRHPIDSSYYLGNPIYTSVEWEIVRNYDAFIAIVLEKGVPEIVSFDHDLADEHYDPDLYGSETYNSIYDNFVFKTGYDCAKWLINYCIDNKKELPATVLIHSMNPAGSLNIKSLFDTYNKYHEKGLM